MQNIPIFVREMMIVNLKERLGKRMVDLLEEDDVADVDEIIREWLNTHNITMEKMVDELKWKLSSWLIDPAGVEDIIRRWFNERGCLVNSNMKVERPALDIFPDTSEEVV